MKVTKIEMSKVKDKKKPFGEAVWANATDKEEAKFYKLLANVKMAQQTC